MSGSFKDLDGDGVVSYEEYMADADMDPGGVSLPKQRRVASFMTPYCCITDAGRVTKAMQQERRQNALIDTDGDGVIEAEEIAALSANLDRQTVSVLDVPTIILEK